MIAATSATVRNLTSLSGVASAAIESPLPTELVRHAGSGASVTPVSSVSPVWKRATPREPCQFAAACEQAVSVPLPRVVSGVTPLARAQLPPAVSGGLDCGQHGRPHAMLLEFPDRVDGG